MNDLQFANDIAVAMNMDSSHFRRFVRGIGMEFVKVRSPISGQIVNALTPEQVDEIREARETAGFNSDGVITRPDKGWFYVIRIVPDLAPNRLKLGYTSDVQTRLSAHRTAAPTATVIECWPCDPAWEKTAITCCTADGCKQIGPEVFDVEDVAQVINKAKAFFDLMPK